MLCLPGEDWARKEGEKGRNCAGSIKTTEKKERLDREMVGKEEK